MKQQQTYMTSGISNMIATGNEIGDVVAKCLQAHNDGIWDYFDEEIGVRDLALGVWEADDENDLIEEVTAASGWCIKSIDYEVQLK